MKFILQAKAYAKNAKCCDPESEDMECHCVDHFIAGYHAAIEDAAKRCERESESLRAVARPGTAVIFVVADACDSLSKWIRAMSVDECDRRNNVQ